MKRGIARWGVVVWAVCALVPLCAGQAGSGVDDIADVLSKPPLQRDIVVVGGGDLHDYIARQRRDLVICNRGGLRGLVTIGERFNRFA